MPLLTGTSRTVLWRALSLTAALMPVLRMDMAPPISAAGPLLTQTAAAALARLRSYQVHVTATSQGALAATFVQTAVVVRTGAQTQLDVVSATRPRGAGETTIVEDVIRSATVCERSAFNAPLPLPGAFTCRRAPRDAAALTAKRLGVEGS